MDKFIQRMVEDIRQQISKSTNTLGDSIPIVINTSDMLKLLEEYEALQEPTCPFCENPMECCPACYDDYNIE